MDRLNLKLYYAVMSSSNTRLYQFTLVALLLSIVMTILSAYIRLADAGYGCSPWPGCFTTDIIVDPDPGVTISGQDSNIVLRGLHRLLATVFGLLALIIMMAALWYRKELRLTPAWSVAVVLIMVILSYVGMNTPNIQFPIITMVNLSGGMLLSMILLHMLLRLQDPTGYQFTVTGLLSILTVIVGFVLVVSGAWVSGNFAAAACDGFLSCGQMQGTASESFALNRKLSIVEGQLASAQIDARITYVHHALTSVFGVLVFVCTVLAITRRGPAFYNLAPPALTIAGIVIGMLEIDSPSLILATMHNALALALLLGLVLQSNKLMQPW
ncbi:MAG: COX15/CtaA family protein [Pseudomonadales bacterium]